MTEKGIFQWFRHEERKIVSHTTTSKRSIMMKRQKKMWIGTHLGGLNKLDLRTNTFTHYRMKEDDPNSLPSDIIRDITPIATN